MSLTLARLGVIAGSFPSLPVGSFESIATVSASGGNISEAVFDNIPQTYKHLQIRVSARSTRSANSADNLLIKYNTDTSSSNYIAYHYLYSSGTSIGTGRVLSGVSASNLAGTLPGSIAPSGYFDSIIIDISNYYSSTNYKTIKVFGGDDYSNFVDNISAAWLNSSPITKISLNASNGSFVQHSILSLYGVK